MLFLLPPPSVVPAAAQDIAPGEELSYDYRFSSEHEKMPCNCGTRSCRGFVNVPSDGFDDDALKARASAVIRAPRSQAR